MSGGQPVTCNGNGNGAADPGAVEQLLRADLVRFGRMLHDRHYVSSTDGNLSARLGPDRLLVTPTRVSKGMMSPEEMVIVDLDGRKVAGPGEPSSEIRMHTAIYRERPDVGGVVHAHPCTATAFASVGLALNQPVCSELALTLGEVPLALYAAPGSPELSQRLRPFLAKYDAVLMESHGVVAYGSGVRQAYLNMEAVEHCARVTLFTQVLGREATLKQEEADRLRALRMRQRSQLQAVLADVTACP